MNRRTFLKTTAIGGAASTLPIPKAEQAFVIATLDSIHFRKMMQQHQEYMDTMRRGMQKRMAQILAENCRGMGIDVHAKDIKWKKVRPPIL